MTGFTIELLYPTGWRRHGEIYWRLQDATKAADKAVSKSHARAARVLPLTIKADEVYSVGLSASQAVGDSCGE